MVQLIEKQKGKFCMNIHGVDCAFMPMSLFVGNNIFPVEAKVKGSTLGWYINRKWIRETILDKVA